MKKFKKIFLTAFAATLGFALFAADQGKNIYNIQIADLPGDLSKLLEKKDLWNFSFRPMGATAQGILITDPIYIEKALSGAKADEECPTSLAVICNEAGFSFVVYCVQPGMDSAMAEGNNPPDGSFEIYFAVGDNDMRKHNVYHQFWLSGEGAKGKCENYSWAVQDRFMKDIKGSAQHTFRVLPQGYIHTLTFPWDTFWADLPFGAKADNFWRLQVNRWTPKAWQTWGGRVHEASRFGYIRWPKFTPEMKAKIEKRILMNAWYDFQRLVRSQPYIASTHWNTIRPYSGKYVEEQMAKVGETYYNYGQDAGFNPILKKINDEHLALGKEIGAFDQLDEAAKDAFYQKAADMLINYHYTVEEAYAKYLREKNFAD